MGGFARHERVAAQLRREIATLIWRELKDPDIGQVTVTDVEVTRDLSVARVYVALPPDAEVTPSLQALQHSAKYLRSLLGKSLRMRSIPELRFEHDDSLDQGERIESLLAQAGVSTDAADCEPDDGEKE